MSQLPELPPGYRDRSPLLASWPGLLVAFLSAAAAAASFAAGSRQLTVILTAEAAVITLLAAGRAASMSRSEGMAARRQLLDVIRGLPPAEAWADFAAGTGYQLQVQPTGIPGLGAGVYVHEIDYREAVRTPGSGRSVIVRRYGLLPWQPRVHLEITSGPLDPAGDGTLAPAPATLTWMRQSRQARRAGLLYAEPGEVRQLAARLEAARRLT
jgi:hypothetical protein